MGYANAVKNKPVSASSPANVTKSAPMGKVVQVKGSGTRGTGPKSNIGKKAKLASVKSSGMSNKAMVTDLPSKATNGRKPGKNAPVQPSGRADVTKANKS